MGNRRIRTAWFLLASSMGWAQDQSLPQSSIEIKLPPDAPIALASADMGESRASARGGAMLLDLHMSLKLRNNSAHRIHGLTMIVSAQEVTPGGKGSFATWLDVGAGEVFPLLIALRLMPPLQPQNGALVQVGLDGSLFNGSSFYGPNRLDSKRTMMVWEAEAQRNRQQFKSILAQSAADGFQPPTIHTLTRQRHLPLLDLPAPPTP